jgi:hypothetical protein
MPVLNPSAEERIVVEWNGGVEENTVTGIGRVESEAQFCLA